MIGSHSATNTTPARHNAHAWPKKRHLVALAGLVVGSLLSWRPALAVTDEFIHGYATAILQRDFQLSAATLQVRGGVIFVQGVDASDLNFDRMKVSLAAIEGVKKVVASQEGEALTDPEKAAISPVVNLFLPRDMLFKPLLADPRWPHFSVSYQHYIDNDGLEGVGSATFGETFSIYRFGGPGHSQMEFGLQAGVFSIFDMDADSHDLINADYFVALPLSIKKNNFSAIARVFHQSSHLGDEYLLSQQTPERINLSYEGVDSILSYNLPFGFRIYGGGGYLFDRTPSDLKPWIAQWGLEFKSPAAWVGGSLRPIAALDIQNREESDWDADLSLRAGLQFENPDFLSRKLQVMFEYYKGRSPNGQFYIRDVEEYVGIGFHFFYD